jgi:hypothetical protein
MIPTARVAAFFPAIERARKNLRAKTMQIISAYRQIRVNPKTEQV